MFISTVNKSRKWPTDSHVISHSHDDYFHPIVPTWVAAPRSNDTARLGHFQSHWAVSVYSLRSNVFMVVMTSRPPVGSCSHSQRRYEPSRWWTTRPISPAAAFRPLSKNKGLSFPFILPQVKKPVFVLCGSSPSSSASQDVWVSIIPDCICFHFLHQLPAQMGSLLGSSLALHYLDCVQDESALLRLNFWLGHALHEGNEGEEGGGGETTCKLLRHRPQGTFIPGTDLGLNPNTFPPAPHIKGCFHSAVWKRCG